MLLKKVFGLTKKQFRFNDTGPDATSIHAERLPDSNIASSRAASAFFNSIDPMRTLARFRSAVLLASGNGVSVGMRSIATLRVSGLLGAALSACIAVAHAQSSQPRCPFSYTDKIQTEVVIPILRDRYKDLYKFYNYDNPSIAVDGNAVDLLLFPSKTIDGQFVVSEYSLRIRLDACTQRVLDVYVLTPPGVNPPLRQNKR